MRACASPGWGRIWHSGQPRRCTCTANARRGRARRPPSRTSSSRARARSAARGCSRATTLTSTRRRAASARVHASAAPRHRLRRLCLRPRPPGAAAAGLATLLDLMMILQPAPGERGCPGLQAALVLFKPCKRWRLACYRPAYTHSCARRTERRRRPSRRLCGSGT